METAGKHSTQRAPGREHFPLYPKGFIAIHIVQLVLAVIVLGLCAYGVSQLAFDGEILLLFTAIATMITCIYIIVAEFGAPALYNYWAILSLDIFLVIFWLISFALLAAEIAPFAGGYCSYYTGYCYSLSTAEETYFAILAAAAGVGGAEFLTFLISLVIHSVMLHRHRKAGLHCKPTTSSSHPAAASTTLPASAEKNGQYSQGQPYPMQNQPAQGHPQQNHLVQSQAPSYPQQAYTSAQQQYYPQRAPSPLSSQATGGAPHQSSIESHQVNTQSAQGPVGTHGQGAPGNPQGPYETFGHSVQRPAQ